MSNTLRSEDYFFTTAIDLAIGLAHMPEGTPIRQRLDALEHACYTLSNKKSTNFTLEELPYLCNNYNMLIKAASLPGYPAAAATTSTGGQPACAVYELEQYTCPTTGTTLGQRIAHLIATHISPTEYSTITEEQDDYGTWLTFNLQH